MLFRRRPRRPKERLEFFWLMQEGHTYRVAVINREGRVRSAMGVFVQYKYVKDKGDMAIIRDLGTGTEVSIPKGIMDQTLVYEII
jgi:hypothetical protein